MAVTTNNVTVFLDAVPNDAADGFIFFDLFEIHTDTIEAQIDITTRYVNQYIRESVRIDKPDLTDDLILHSVVYRLLSVQILGEIIPSGFSFTTLDLKVDTDEYPDIMEQILKDSKQRVIDLKNLLKRRVRMSRVNFKPNGTSTQFQNIRTTATWRGF